MGGSGIPGRRLCHEPRVSALHIELGSLPHAHAPAAVCGSHWSIFVFTIVEPLTYARRILVLKLPGLRVAL